MNQYIRWFSEIGIDDIPVVGGKNASLGELYSELASENIRVPGGFAVTADAYRHFLREARLDEKIAEYLSDIDTRNIEVFGAAARRSVM
jgi:pyruvate,water dikinase